MRIRVQTVQAIVFWALGAGMAYLTWADRYIHIDIDTDV